MRPVSDIASHLPPSLAARYRSKRHLAALVKIGRVLRGVGMTWASLHRALEEAVQAEAAAADRAEWLEYPSDTVLATVERLEDIRPWSEDSSAPEFMMTLRNLMSEGDFVRLSSRQVEWLELLLAKANKIELKRQTERTDEKITGNVVPISAARRAAKAKKS